ncbi:histidine kinase, partial [Vibrio alfacsensis]
SDTAPIDFNNAKSGINRRIELYILTAETLAQLNKVYKAFTLDQATRPSPLAEKELDIVLRESQRKALQQAEYNQPVTSFEVMNRYD